jgi:hypothetical protein
MPDFPAIDSQGHNTPYPQSLKPILLLWSFFFFVFFFVFFFFFAEAQPATGVAEFRGSVRTPYN